MEVKSNKLYTVPALNDHLLEAPGAFPCGLWHHQWEGYAFTWDVTSGACLRLSDIRNGDTLYQNLEEFNLKSIGL